MKKDFTWLIYGQLGTFMWHKKANPKRVADPNGRYIADRMVIEVDNFFVRLAQAGYDMLPVGSNWIPQKKRTPGHATDRRNLPNLFAWAKANLPSGRFAGFGAAPWAGMKPAVNRAWFEAAELLGEIKAKA